MELLHSFFRRHFAGKPEVASWNVGCFLRLLNVTWSPELSEKKSPVHFFLSCGLVIFYCRRIWFNVSIVHPLHALSLRSSHQTMSFFGVCSISLGKKEMNLRFKLTRSVLSFCKRNDHLFQLNHVIIFVPACVRSRMKLKQVGGLCSATF